MTAIKYILYFHLYFLSGVRYDITTTVAISADSLRFYIYDVGYIKWRIDEKLEEVCHYDYYSYKVTYFSARYAISHKDIKGLAVIGGHKSEIIIIGDGKSYHILLKKEK